MKWTIIILAIALSLNGCADTADAETSSMATTSKESNNDSTTTTSSGDTVWAAIIMTWNPVVYTIDKEFTSEVDCWNYYDTGVGESKMLNSYGTQVLDHQGNKPERLHEKTSPSAPSIPNQNVQKFRRVDYVVDL
tara:strand:+ start:818 stop:1222 length:405 start_codon:yes stop_codon:yes gene_type:complete